MSWPRPCRAGFADRGMTFARSTERHTLASDSDEDDGRPFDPSSAPAPRLDLPLEERPLGGLGVHLARRVTDAIEYRRQDDRNILRMRKRTA